MLLDSDTTPSAITPELVHKLGIRANGPKGKSSGVGSNAQTVTAVRLQRVSIGSTVVHDMVALTADLSAVGKRLHLRLDGVIGTSFLDNHLVQIDYPCREVRFLNRPPPGTTIAFTPGDDLLVRDAYFNGRRATATVDTGNGGDVSVTKKGVATLHLQASASSGRRTTVLGYNGQSAVTHGVAPSLRLGYATFTNAPAVFILDDPSAYDVNIGNSLLDHRVLTLDYIHHRLGLTAPGECGCKAAHAALLPSYPA